MYSNANVKLSNPLQLRLILHLLQSIEAAKQPLTPVVYKRREEILALSQRHNLGIQPLFDAPLFDGHVLVPGQHTDFVFMRVAEDPLFHHPDKFPVPQHVFDRLQRMLKLGVQVDDLYIAHELEKGTLLSGQRATAEMVTPPPSQVMVQQSQQLGTVVQKAWETAVLPIWGSLMGIAGAGAVTLGLGALAVAGIAAVAPLIALDPLLIGVVKDPNHPLQPGTPATWLLLASWIYGE